MSTNRENVIWKTRDGTWSIGFYDFYYTGDSSDEDFDHEWDVEYDFGRFNWVSTGHPTQESAMNAWHGSNPGCHEIVEEPSAETDALDALVKAFRK